MSKSNSKPGVILPPAVGYSLKIILRLIKTNIISLRYYPRLIIIVLINLINWPFRTYERLFINPRFKNKTIDKEPVFIIGHWRSGTTHLHNLLSQDKQMGYITTFQSVFPDTIFNKAGYFLFKNFTRLLIPGTRKGDNVVLNTKYPQEEEFALGYNTPYSYYYFWMFPRNIQNFYKSSIRFEGVADIEMMNWKSDYKLLIKKALKYTDGQRLLSKNPPNTARIKVLLEMFPNAKFIHIYRNPVEVFLSTKHFFEKMMPHLKLHSIDQKEVEADILNIYKVMMNDYFEQKQLIPEASLIEVAYENLEGNPNKVLEGIYKKLKLPGYENALPLFEKYIKQAGSYKKNTHTISREALNNVLSEWDFTMKRFNYSVPENIEVVD